MAATTNVQVIIDAKDNASSTLKSFGNTASSVGEDLTRSFQKGGLAAGALLGAITALGVAAVKVASDFEQNRISFEVLIGNAELARKTLKNLSDFAVKTPFELPQLMEGAKRLLAYNIEAKDLIPTLSTLGNIASGVGMEKLPQLIVAFGQVKAATKLTGMELRQFTEAGVPMLQMLVDQANKAGGSWVTMGGSAKKSAADIKELGDKLAIAKQRLAEVEASTKTKTSTLMSYRNAVENAEQALAKANGTMGNTTRVWSEAKVTVQDMQERISDGKVTFEEVSKALNGLAGEGGKWGDLMEKQSKTFGGTISNIKDQVTRSLTEIAGVSIEQGGLIREGSLFSVMKQAADAVLQTLNTVTPKIVEMSNAIAQNRNALLIIAGALGGVLVLALGALVVTFGAALLVLGQFILIGAAVGAMVVGLISIFENWDLIVKSVVDFFTVQVPAMIGMAIIAIVTWFQNLWTNGIQFFNDLFIVQIPTAVGFAIGWLSVKIPELVNNIIVWLGKLPGKILAIFTDIYNKITSKIGETILWLSEELPTWPERIFEWIKAIPDRVGKVFGDAKDVALKKMNELLEGVKSIWGQISKILDDLSSKVGAAIFNFNLAREAGARAGGKQTGGIVPGPIGAAVPIIAHAGERVIPAGLSGSVGGGGGSVTFNVSVGLYAGSETEKRNIAKELYSALLQVAQSQNKSVSEYMTG